LGPQSIQPQPTLSAIPRFLHLFSQPLRQWMLAHTLEALACPPV
jgi:hypothetical protein